MTKSEMLREAFSERPDDPLLALEESPVNLVDVDTREPLVLDYGDCPCYDCTWEEEDG